MKILHTESSCGWGGQELRILSEATSLLERHRDVEIVIAVDYKSQFLGRNPQIDRLRFVQCPLARKSLVGLIAMAMLIVKEAPDFLATHSSTDSWLSALALKIVRLKTPIIRYRHIATPIRPTFLNRWLYRQATHVVTTSDQIKTIVTEAVGVRPSRVSAIPTGIDSASRFKPLKPGKGHISFGGSTIKLGMVATLRSWKGHALVVEALANLPNCELLIVGDGPQRTVLEKLAEDFGVDSRVKFFGHQHDVAPIFKTIDIFIHPSLKYEGVSQSLLQAGALEIPIIASSIGGTVEVVEHEITGLLIDIGSVSQIVAAVKRLVRAPSLAAQLAQNARKRVKEKHSIERMVERIEAIYGLVERSTHHD